MALRCEVVLSASHQDSTLVEIERAAYRYLRDHLPSVVSSLPADRPKALLDEVQYDFTDSPVVSQQFNEIIPGH